MHREPMVPAALPRTASTHSAQGIFQSWPPNALDSTGQGDKWLTAEVGLSNCNCKSDCFQVFLLFEYRL